MAQIFTFKDLADKHQFAFVTASMTYIGMIKDTMYISDFLWLSLENVKIGELKDYKSLSTKVSADEVWLAEKQIISIIPISLDE